MLIQLETLLSLCFKISVVVTHWDVEIDLILKYVL